jgi:hypothetical protein
VRSTGNINSPVPEEFQPDQNYCGPETEDKIVGRQSIRGDEKDKLHLARVA